MHASASRARTQIAVQELEGIATRGTHCRHCTNSECIHDWIWLLVSQLLTQLFHFIQELSADEIESGLEQGRLHLGISLRPLPL